MASRIRRALTFANVCSFLALTIAMGTGGAYAANTVFSSDIVDGEVKSQDLGADSVTFDKIKAGHVFNSDLAANAVGSGKVLDNSLTGSDILDGSLGTTDIADGGLMTSDLAISSITGSRIAASAVTTSDIANRTVNMDDIDGADRSGGLSIGTISNGRCATITGSVSGAQPGDVAVLTTNGSIPNGMTIQAQRALTNAVEIKVCNLTGATSSAISDLPVRVITLH